MNFPTRSGLIFLAAATLTACVTTPYTNRKQFILVSEGEEDQMGLQAYNETLKTAKISKDPAANEMLQRVGKRIAQAADKPEYHWQFTLIDEPKTVNAFCLPGGRVAVYTGILPITQDESGLAVVLSHEVSHAIARHGAERISEQQAAGVAQQLAVEAGVIKNAETLQVVQLAYGIGAGLPHSRAQESEADHIGIILMAKAGYDPRTAIPFWQRMAQASGGNAPPTFLSTHPSDKQRVQRIQEQMPEALRYYKP